MPLSDYARIRWLILAALLTTTLGCVKTAPRDASDRPNNPTTIEKVVIRDAKASEKGPTPK